MRFPLRVNRNFISLCMNCTIQIDSYRFRVEETWILPRSSWCDICPLQRALLTYATYGGTESLGYLRSHFWHGPKTQEIKLQRL
eukprot:c17966_g2_i1 orf=220-471(+)